MCRHVYEQSMNHISLKSVLVGLPHQLHWGDQMMGGGGGGEGGTATCICREWCERQ